MISFDRILNRVLPLSDYLMPESVAANALRLFRELPKLSSEVCASFKPKYLIPISASWGQRTIMTEYPDSGGVTASQQHVSRCIALNPSGNICVAYRIEDSRARGNAPTVTYSEAGPLTLVACLRAARTVDFGSIKSKLREFSEVSHHS